MGNSICPNFGGLMGGLMVIAALRFILRTAMLPEHQHKLHHGHQCQEDLGESVGSCDDGGWNQKRNGHENALPSQRHGRLLHRINTQVEGQNPKDDFQIMHELEGYKMEKAWGQEKNKGKAKAVNETKKAHARA
jgi:hypothetical protein